MRTDLTESLAKLFTIDPEAYALIYGSKDCPGLRGTVYFYPMWEGTMVIADIAGLPYSPDDCGQRVFGFHIHEGSECKGDFSTTGGHFNPKNCSHPQHTGDLPPLFENHGYAFLMYYTDRFQPEEVIGRTIVIHQYPDDFTTQPSGNSGKKIGCGEIKSSF